MFRKRRLPNSLLARRVENPDVSLLRVAQDPFITGHEGCAGEASRRNQNAIGRIAVNLSGKGGALDGN